MKVLKISLVIIVVAAIAFFVMQSLVATEQPDEYESSSKNQFTQRIEQEIGELQEKPNSKFCGDFYKEVAYHIDSYYKEGRLGESPVDNEQSKETLSSNLYSAYVEKFIEQAFYVFNNSEWKIADLNFIRSEYKNLQKSKFLEKGSLVDGKLKDINNILSKYDAINGFIASCKAFSYSELGLSSHFPISDVEKKIDKSKTYLNNRLGNESVNKCTRLKDGLKEIPKILFKAHVSYLDKKIEHWSNMYSQFVSQKEYADDLYKPLKKEIEDLENNIYKVVNFDKERDRLLEKWGMDNRKAYKHDYQTEN